LENNRPVQDQPIILGATDLRNLRQTILNQKAAEAAQQEVIGKQAKTLAQAKQIVAKNSEARRTKIEALIEKCDAEMAETQQIIDVEQEQGQRVSRAGLEAPGRFAPRPGRAAIKPNVVGPAAKPAALGRASWRLSPGSQPPSLLFNF
jgi:thioredoxin-like negative regulator of GroEL